MKGVSFDKKSQKYRAYISVGGERFYLGFFQTEQEAINKRLEAESKYFDQDGMLDLSWKFSQEQLFALFLDYLIRKSVYKCSFKRYVFSNKHLNPIPHINLPVTAKGNNNPANVALIYLINGNSLDAIARQMSVSEYDLIKLLKPFFN